MAQGAKLAAVALICLVLGAAVGYFIGSTIGVVPISKYEEVEAQLAQSSSTVASLQATLDALTLKVAFVYVGPVEDYGWTYAHNQGRLYLEEHIPFVNTTYVESVPEAEAETVIRQLAEGGYEVIFTTSYGFMDPTLEVAKEYPRVLFMHCSGFKRWSNMGTYFGRIQDAVFLTGIVAGAMTKVGKLGFVAAYPIPEVIRNINAFTLGAKLGATMNVNGLNPEDVNVTVVWTKTWVDPAIEAEAAQTLVDMGCDILTQHQDTPATQQKAQTYYEKWERGEWSYPVYSTGYHSDMHEFAPDSHLTAAVWNWAPIYDWTIWSYVTGKVQNWSTVDVWWGLSEEVVDIAPFNEAVPQQVQAFVLQVKEELVSGVRSSFQGPIYDQDGNLRIPEGRGASDVELLTMDYFVEGVLGSPKG